MRVVLKGIHTSRKRLSDGTTKTYYYAWKNGPRINAAPGTPAFINEYNQHLAARRAPDNTKLAGIISLYKRMELPKKADKTRRGYLRAISLIEEEFGTMPIAAIEERGSRAEFMAWRDTMADRPRTADLSWSVLQRILSFGVDQELLTRNPCERAGRLASTGTRREKVWTPAHIAKMKAKCPQHVYDVLVLARWTGQRQGDLLSLTWANYDGKYIRLEQSKGKKRITVMVAGEAREMLERRRAAIKAADVAHMAILTTSRNMPWSEDGFRASWQAAVKKAGVTGLTFHDLRGTFVTEARRSGSSIEDIAQITGHTIKDVTSILEQHYLADDPKAAEAVILKMNRKKP